MKKIFIAGLLQLLFSVANAQRPLECGKYRIDAAANEAALQYGAAHQRPEVVTRMIRVYFNIVTNDDGTQAAATPAQVETEFAQIVNDYASNSLCFANMGFRYIRSTNINYNINCDDPASYSALDPWLTPGCISVFFQQALGSNSGNGYGGNAYAIPNTFCSVATGNLNTGKTTSHEVGHCLGLLHTFETAFGMENINGNNCGSAGDQVCDTPADPWGSGACFSNAGCSYTGNCLDGNGAGNFSPPYTNIMSYWWGAGCIPTNFSNGQFARVNNFLATNAPLQTTLSPSNLVYGPVTVTSLSTQSAIFNLTTNGNVLLTGNCRVGMAGRKVTLNPGFRANPSTGKVTIRGNMCFY